MTKLFSSSQTPPSNPSPLPRQLPCGMKSGVSWRAGAIVLDSERDISENEPMNRKVLSHSAHMRSSSPCHVIYSHPGSLCVSPSLPVCSGARRTAPWLFLGDSTVMFLSLFLGFPWPSTGPGSVRVRENLSRHFYLPLGSWSECPGQSATAQPELTAAHFLSTTQGLIHTSRPLRTFLQLKSHDHV